MSHWFVVALSLTLVCYMLSWVNKDNALVCQMFGVLAGLGAVACTVFAFVPSLAG